MSTPALNTMDKRSKVNLHVFNAEIWNVRGYTLPPPNLICCLIKHRDNFSLLLLTPSHSRETKSVNKGTKVFPAPAAHVRSCHLITKVCLPQQMLTGNLFHMFQPFAFMYFHVFYRTFPFFIFFFNSFISHFNSSM